MKETVVFVREEKTNIAVFFKIWLISENKISTIELVVVKKDYNEELEVHYDR